MLRNSIATVSLALAVTAGPACGADKVLIGFPNPTGFSQGNGPFWMAQELKYFEAEGLEVSVINLTGSGVVHTQAAQKAIDVGWSDPVDFRQPGRDPLPTKYFYNDLRNNIWEIAVLANSPIKSLQDFKGGKKIGVGALGWANVTMTRAMLVEAGAIPDKDVNLIAVGLGASAYEALRTGKVDALNLFDVAHATLENLGTPIRRLPIPPHHQDVAGFGFIAHVDTIKTRGDTLGKFGRAWAKGLVACYANMPVCVKAFYQRRPTSRPAGVDEAKLVADGVRNLQSRAGAYFKSGPQSNEKIGDFTEQSFRNTINALHSQGILQTGSVPVADLFTNQFVDKFNQFDRAQVRRDAAQAK